MEPITSNMIGDFTDVGLVDSGDGGLKGGKFARLVLAKDLNYVVGKGELTSDNDVEASELGQSRLQQIRSSESSYRQIERVFFPTPVLYTAYSP